jgi:hypothetical protein
MKKTAKPKESRSQIVKALAASGLPGDAIAAMLKVGQNRLRREHALDLFAGRTAKNVAAKAAAAAALSRRERERRDLIKRSFASHWFDPLHGNDLFGRAKNIREALAWCDRFKSGRAPK